MKTPEALTNVMTAARNFVTSGKREREWLQRLAEQKHLEFLTRRLFNRGHSLVTRHSDLPLKGLNVDLEDGTKAHLAFNQIYTSSDHGIVTISVEGDTTFLNLQNDPTGLSGGIVNRVDLEQSRVRIKDQKFGFTFEKQFMPKGIPITQEGYDRYSRILDEAEAHYRVPVPELVKLRPKSPRKI